MQDRVGSAQYWRRQSLTEARTSWRRLGTGMGSGSLRISAEGKGPGVLRKQPAPLCAVTLPPISHL